jgi:hypothetical protein
VEPIEIEGVPVPKGEPSPMVDNRNLLKEYFATIRLPILAGRALTPDEISRGANVAVVNKTMAQKFWSVDTAVNKRFRETLSLGSHKELPWITIVGVGDDSHDLQGSERQALPVMYAPFASNSDITFIVRTAGAIKLLTGFLKSQSGAQLDLARKVDLVPRHDPEQVGIQRRVRSVVDRCIKDVECFTAELQVVAFADQCVLKQ